MSEQSEQENGKGGGVDPGHVDRLIGANIRRYREARDLSQAELAEQLDMHQQTVQKIEKGTRPLKHSEAIRFASALKVPLHELTARDTAAEIAAEAMRHSGRFSQLNRQVKALAKDIADALVDFALVSGFIQRGLHEGEIEDDEIGASLTAAQTWLIHNWGQTLNTQIMTALRSNEFLADMREEFDADSYAEVVQRVREHRTVLHPSTSRMPLVEALKYRRPKPDESEA